MNLSYDLHTKEAVTNMENDRSLCRQYKPLSVKIKLSDELTVAINAFMDHINYGSGSAEDCYRDEVDFWLKDSFGKLPDDDYHMLRQYYVLGGIYAEYGKAHRSASD